MEWHHIESAPKDGSPVLLLSLESQKVALGKWDPEGSSWVDEYGDLNGDAYDLAVTGTWSSGGGWFQPNEVSHWMPLPEPPTPPAS